VAERRCKQCDDLFVPKHNHAPGLYCSHKCRGLASRKEKIAGKYIRVRVEGHPLANHQGYVAEHRLMVEQSIGRYLEPGEVVHHINGDKHDNRLENLQLMTAAQHSSHHMKEVWRRANGAMEELPKG